MSVSLKGFDYFVQKSLRSQTGPLGKIDPEKMPGGLRVERTWAAAFEIDFQRPLRFSILWCLCLAWFCSLVGERLRGGTRFGAVLNRRGALFLFPGVRLPPAR